MPVVAFILFLVAGILNGLHAHTNDWFAPMTLACFGLAAFALPGLVTYVSSRTKP
jgi:hypothetical protein